MNMVKLLIRGLERDPIGSWLKGYQASYKEFGPWLISDAMNMVLLSHSLMRPARLCRCHLGQWWRPKAGAECQVTCHRIS